MCAGVVLWKLNLYCMWPSFLWRGECSRTNKDKYSSVDEVTMD